MELLFLKTSLQTIPLSQQVNVTVYGNPTSSTSGIVSGTVSGYANYFNLNASNRIQ